MKIYLASKFSFKNKVEEIYKILMDYGHHITCVWWHDDVKRIGGTDKNWYSLPLIQNIAKRDFKGIDDADILILIAPQYTPVCFNGANVELGYAYAKNKKIIIYGAVDRNALYFKCIFVQSIDELLREVQ